MKKIRAVALGIIIFILMLSTQWLSTSGRESTYKSAQQQIFSRSLRDLPFYFAENRGQTSPCVKFHLKMNGAAVYFTQDEIVYQFVLSEVEQNPAGESALRAG